MKEIIVQNAEGKQLTVNVVRFFRLNGIEYLIFSLNEMDEGGYVKLYVSKIVDGMGKTIDDDVEWNLIKDTIKTIIKANKDNLILPIADLNSDRINNLTVIDQKIFKLNDSLLQLLTANQKVEDIIVPSSELNMASGGISVNSVEQTNFGTKIVDAQQQIANSILENPQFNEITTPQTGINEISQNVTPNSISTPQANPIVDYAIDYQTLYNNELLKNEELTREIQKYKDLLNRVKATLNENI